MLLLMEVALTKSTQPAAEGTPTPRGSRLTAAEHRAVERALQKRLGPNFLSSRPAQGGQRVVYLEGWKSIAIANKIFGFNGWSDTK